MSRILTAAAVAAVLALAHPAAAQPTLPPPGPQQDTLGFSLADAVGRALATSEEIGLAESQMDLTDAQVRQAYAALYPQINGNLAYQRTLASAFDTGGGFEIPDSLRFDPDPTLPLEERVAYLEQNASNAALGALGGLFGDLPFGQENVYSFNVTGTQTLFSAQAGVGVRIARLAREATEYGLTETIADIRLQVEQAYIQALLAQELVFISEAALVQAQAFLDEERLRLRAGTASELEVLRAEVDLENLRPRLVQAQDAADLAVLNLKRLTNVPFDQPIALTTPLSLPTPEAMAEIELDPAAAVAHRAALRAAEQQVAIREQQVRLQRAAYYPSISLQSSYGQQLFPTSIFAFDTEPRTDWTVSVGVQVPIFDGFRRRAQVAQARVELSQAEFQLEQLRENLRLQVEQALNEKRRAAALIAARQRTVEQAARVYHLTQLQYDEGLATQLEVSNARLALLQARSNLVQALADFYLADTSLIRASVTPGAMGAGFAMPDGEPLPRPDGLGAPTPTDSLPRPGGDLLPDPIPDDDPLPPSGDQ